MIRKINFRGEIISLSFLFPFSSRKFVDILFKVTRVKILKKEGGTRGKQKTGIKGDNGNDKVYDYFSLLNFLYKNI